MTNQPHADDPLIGSNDVVELARITYRQLDHWVRAEYVRPRQNGHGHGSGHMRVWSIDEVAVCVRMGVLVEVGLTPQAAARIAREGWPS
jgi:DNA-binding transcriptional MerR regulator